MKKIALLGSTGSVGCRTLDVIRANRDIFEVVALAAGNNCELLIAQALEFAPKVIGIMDSSRAQELAKAIPGADIVCGQEGGEKLASLSEVDIVVMAISGAAALLPAIAAIKAKKRLAIASKEVFVCAGEYIASLAKEHGAEIVPVDSEHSAIFQCLKNEERKTVKRLILTASGGPLLNYPLHKLSVVSLEEVLAHPTYKMGPKISVDSSNMMNKGLEIIEAHYLFGIELHKIDVIIHPQSLVHSFVEFHDGALLAQISPPDMYLPIQYALTWPDRVKTPLPEFDFKKFAKFEFFEPDEKRFPCLRLAKEALKEGKSFPCFLNAANEVLVARFIKQEIGFASIPLLLEKLISFHRPENLLNLDAILAVDARARHEARAIVEN